MKGFVVSSGSFAVVMKATLNGGSRVVAVRFLTLSQEGLEERYRSLSTLEGEASRYVGLPDYMADEVKIPGFDRLFPAVVADWVPGRTLGDYVKQLCDSSDVDRLRALRDELTKMRSALWSDSFSHGDLSTENVMVIDDGSGPTLQLVDLDSAWFPAIGALPCSVGRGPLHHPDRPANPGLWADRMAFLMFDLGLAFLEKFPSVGEEEALFENRFVLTVDDVLGGSERSSLRDRVKKVCSDEFQRALEYASGAYDDRDVTVNSLKRTVEAFEIADHVKEVEWLDPPTSSRITPSQYAVWHFVEDRLPIGVTREQAVLTIVRAWTRFSQSSRRDLALSLSHVGTFLSEKLSIRADRKVPLSQVVSELLSLSPELSKGVALRPSSSGSFLVFNPARTIVVDEEPNVFEEAMTRVLVTRHKIRGEYKNVCGPYISTVTDVLAYYGEPTGVQFFSFPDEKGHVPMRVANVSEIRAIYESDVWPDVRMNKRVWSLQFLASDPSDPEKVVVYCPSNDLLATEGRSSTNLVGVLAIEEVAMESIKASQPPKLRDRKRRVVLENREFQVESIEACRVDEVVRNPAMQTAASDCRLPTSYQLLQLFAQKKTFPLPKRSMWYGFFVTEIRNDEEILCFQPFLNKSMIFHPNSTDEVVVIWLSETEATV